MKATNYNLMQGDCLELLKGIETESIDAVVVDPPYQYLNRKRPNCDFDKPYDEKAYIAEVKRCLKDTGFIVMFGRGVSYYRQGVLGEFWLSPKCTLLEFAFQANSNVKRQINNDCQASNNLIE